MTLTINKSCSLTKDPEQSPNPYLRPLFPKKKKNRTSKKISESDDAVIVSLSHQQHTEEKK